MILLTHERQWRGGETAVAFGMFDGVHEGHAQLMRKANELAALYDLKSVVYTFSSHPMATYAPDRVPPVPMPATKMSSLPSVCCTSSGPVVS